MSSDPVSRLVHELSILPGIGERTALRLALYLLEQKKDVAINLADSLVNVVTNVVECSRCCNLTSFSTICNVCQKSGRDQSVIAVVSSIQDLMALESSGGYDGLYHVLHGVLQPMNRIGPDSLRIGDLQKRLVGEKAVKEIILATPATIEGEATALYIRELINAPIKVSRIAAGVPVGGELQFVDRLSLSRSLLKRYEWDG